MDPAGKVAVVTGGNSGLGEGAALRLAQLGATVVTLDRAGEPPAGTTTIACDVGDPASVKAAVAEVIARHGAIHILLNNAGIGGIGPIASADGARRHRGLPRGDRGQPARRGNGRGRSRAPDDGQRAVGARRRAWRDRQHLLDRQLRRAGRDGRLHRRQVGARGADAGLGARPVEVTHPRDGHRARVHGDADGRVPADAFVAELLKDAEFPKRAGTGEDFAEVAEFIIRTPLLNGDVIRLDAGTRPPAATHWSRASRWKKIRSPRASRRNMRQALRAFESALGADKVFFEQVDRTGYRDKFAIQEGAHLPVGAIGPTTVEEVQAALRVANQYSVPYGRSAAARTSATAVPPRCSPAAW
jgi:hypothetical protein